MASEVGAATTSGLVGREPELDGLLDAWRAGGAVRVVRGPAGIGKSRLVRELTARASAQGGSVLAGRATAASTASPLRPLREALLAAARTGLRPGRELAPFVPALAALVPEWGPSAETAASPLLLGEAILRLLTATAGKRTATLVVDDLQWADPETLAVVEYLADNLRGSPVLLVLTLREGEPGDGADLIRSLVGRRVAEEVVLAPLDRAEVLALAQVRLGAAELPVEVVDALVARSEGVPFVVEELVATAASAGWESVAAAVPGSVVATVELRLERLPDAARPLLVAAALLGRLFDWTLAARMVGLSDAEAADHLRLAVRSQLVDVEGAGYRFHHALTRDAVLVSAAPAELVVLARHGLDALLADGEPTGERLLLAAELAERAGDPERTATLLTSAARQAIGAGALGSADRFATRAVEMAGPSARPRAQLTLLEALVLAGDTARARIVGADLLGGRLSAAEEADVHLHLGAVDLAAGDFDDAEARADAAAALVARDPARAARVEALAAHAAIDRDLVDQAVARAAAALDAAEATGQAAVRCEALEVLGRAERGRDLPKAEAAFQRAHDIAAAAGLDVWRVRALQELGTVDMYTTLGVDRLLEARRVAVEIGALATAAVVDVQLAAVYDERGELDLALQAALRGEQAARRWRLSTLPISLTIQGMVHARRADRPAMEQVIAAARATGADVDYVEAGIGANVEPIYHLAMGDLPSALACLERAMDVLRERPAIVVPLPGLWALVRTLLDDDGDAARAEAHGLPYDTPTSQRMLGAADAVALGRAGAAEAAGAQLASSERRLEGIGGGFRHPFIRLLVAPAAHGDGWGEPEAWLREACASFEAMGLDAFAARCRDHLRSMGAPVPRKAKAATTTVPPALAGLGVTAREVGVLALVAAGATNREIGEQLFISTRTVDKHVEHLLQKIGTSSRFGLAAVARDVGLIGT